MPRKPRFFLPQTPVQVVQRGHNREPIFFDDRDYRAYLDGVAEGGNRYGCAVHAYVLMPDHVHLLLTPRDRDGTSRLLQYIGRRYVPYVNKKYGTSGSLWEGRFKSCLVQGERHLLDCMRYIELNPVRAGLARGPAQYRWSSYRANARGAQDRLVGQHDEYRRLGCHAEARCSAYRALFQQRLGAEELAAIRAAWQTGTPLGDESFRRLIEARLDLSVGYARRGRPKKDTKPV